MRVHDNGKTTLWPCSILTFGLIWHSSRLIPTSECPARLIIHLHRKDPYATLTSFAHGTFTVEGSHSIMAGGSIETDGSSAVIDVLAAALSRPAIDTNARVPTLGVEAGASVVAGIGLELTFIHIFRTELTCGKKKSQFQIFNITKVAT